MPKRSKNEKAARPTPRSRVALTVDARLKKAWMTAFSAVASAKRRGAGAFDELWESVAEIAHHDPPLYLADGCATFRDFLSKHLPDVDERTAKRYMRVAQFASPDEEVKYTVSKIDAALTLLEARAGAERSGRLPVDFEKLKVPVHEGGSTKQIAFAVASVDQIRKAARLAVASGGARARGGGAAKESPVVVAIRKRLRGELAHVTLRVSGGVVSFGNVGLHHVAALGKALAAFELPSESP